MIGPDDILLPYRPSSPEVVRALTTNGTEVVRGLTLASVVDRLRLRVSPDDVWIEARYGKVGLRVDPSSYAAHGEWLGEDDLLEPEVFAPRYERSDG